jgi:hypothetical protein
MASSNLQILVQAFVQGLDQLQQLGKQMAQVGVDAQQAGQSAGGAAQGFTAAGQGAANAGGQLAQFVAQGQQAAASFNSLIEVVKGAAVAFAGFVAVASMKDAADISARNETLGVTLGIVGKNAGYTTEELVKYETEVKGLGITTSAARDSLIQMIQAGLQIGPVAAGGASQIALMARAAQDLAVVTGENSSATLRRMITNIQQLDVVGLRFMGIVVNLEDATAKYAEKLGKTAGALTSTEKQQALLNAAMEKARGLQGAYEASLDTVGKKLSSMKRYQEEAASAIGNTLLPAYTVLVDAATAFLKKVQEIASGIAESGKVAQVLKDIMRGVLDFAGEITSALVGALQSIAPALESAFSKLQEAFKDIDLGGITEGFKTILGYAVDFGTAVVNAIGDAAPSIRLLVDAFGMVGSAIMDAVKEIFSFGEGMGDANAAGDLLSTLLQSLGLLVAGFADGLNAVKAVAEVMFAGLTVGFGAIANVIGDVVGLVSKDLGQAFKQVGDTAIEMGMKSAEAARKTFESFSTGETYVQKYADKLKELPAAHEADAEAAKKSADVKKEAFNQAEELVRKYTRAVNDGKLSGEAAATEFKNVTAEIATMAKEFDFTQKEVEQLNNKLQGSLDKSDKTAEAFKTLGTTASDFGKQTSAAGTRAVEAFNQLAQSGKLTSEELYRAFDKALNMETSIAGLTQFRQALDQAFKDGKISAEEYGSAVQLVGAKFDELLDKQLKAAHTKEDFKQLEDQVKALGDSGAISGQQVSSALEKIQEKASGAREEIQRLAQQQTALAEASTRLAKADLAATQANIEVQRAMNALIQAEIRFRQDGTELAQQELEAARLNVQLAEQREQLAQLQRQQESAAMDVLIAKQQLLNAEKEKELNIGNATIAAKVDAARKELESKQLVLEHTKQDVESQQQNVIVTQAAAEQARVLADNMRDAADNTKKAAEAGNGIKGWVVDSSEQIATFTSDSVVQQFRQIGLSLEEASKRAYDLMGGMNAVVAFGKAGVNHYYAIMKAIQDTKKELEAQAEAAKSVEENYRKVKAQAEDIASGAEDATNQMVGWGAGADAVSEAYRRIRKDARDAATAANDAARSFVNSALSIREELLNAQGREDEATKLRYSQRQKELALEYQMLQVKIRAAIVTAKAAGVNTGDLEKSLADASSAYQQAQSDLKELERLDLESISKKREEEKKAAEEAKARAAEDARKSAEDKKAAATEDTASRVNALTVASQVPRAVANSTSSVQSIANECPMSGGSSKTVTVNFTLGSSSVPVQVAAGDEAQLLDLLQRARGVA